MLICVYICMLQGNGGNIPKFGEWKTTDGGSPYTMYFENARKQRNNSGITVPPGASPARTNTVPSGHRTPPRAPDVKPVKQQDGANRSRNQAKVSKLKRSFHMISGGASWGLLGMACRSIFYHECAWARVSLWGRKNCIQQQSMILESLGLPRSLIGRHDLHDPLWDESKEDHHQSLCYYRKKILQAAEHREVKITKPRFNTHLI